MTLLIKPEPNGALFIARLLSTDNFHNYMQSPCSAHLSAQSVALQRPFVALHKGKLNFKSMLPQKGPFPSFAIHIDTSGKPYTTYAPYPPGQDTHKAERRLPLIRKLSATGRMQFNLLPPPGIRSPAEPGRTVTWAGTRSRCP